jgi:hypothetical protein
MLSQSYFSEVRLIFLFIIDLYVLDSEIFNNVVLLHKIMVVSDNLK